MKAIKDEVVELPIFYQSLNEDKSFFGVLFYYDIAIEARGKTKIEVKRKIKEKAKKQFLGFKYRIF